MVPNAVPKLTVSLCEAMARADLAEARRFLRGLVLSVKETAVKSLTPTALKSVPFGKCGDHPNCLTTPVAARSAACLALPKRGVYGTSMARTVKMTFTLDQDTSARIDRTALRLGIPKSAVVREAVAEYAARAGRTSEQDRLLMLSVFDDLLARIPLVPAESADPELAALRRARQSGGRSTPAARKK